MKEAIYLIFSGKVKGEGTTGTIIKGEGKVKATERIQNEILKDFSSKFSDTIPPFFNELKEAQKKNKHYILGEQYHKMIGAIAQIGLILLRDRIRGERRNLSELVKCINSNQKLLECYGVSSSEINSICRFLAEKTNEEVGVKLTGGGMGGDVLILDPEGVLDYSLKDILNKLRKDPGYHLVVHYNSRQDGKIAQPITVIGEPKIESREREFEDNCYLPKVPLQFRQIYSNLVEYTKKELGETKEGLRILSYTDHTFTHSQRVIGYLAKLTDYFLRLKNDGEILALLISALFHDFGMFNDRATHHEHIEKMILSGDRVVAPLLKVIQDKTSRRILSYILKKHSSKSGNIKSRHWEEKFRVKESEYSIRTQFLAALLRVADSCDIDKRRAVESDNILIKNNYSRTSIAYHLSHRRIKCVQLKRGKITVWSYEDSEDIRFFKRYVEKHIREVHHILRKGGIDLSQEVEFKVVPANKNGGRPSNLLQNHFEEILKSVRKERYEVIPKKFKACKIGKVLSKSISI